MEIKEKLKRWFIMVRTNQCLGCCLFCEWWNMCKWETEERRKKKMIFLGTPGMKEFLKRKHPKILQEHPRDWHEVITKDTWDEYGEWKQTDEGKKVIGKL